MAELALHFDTVGTVIEEEPALNTINMVAACGNEVRVMSAQ